MAVMRAPWIMPLIPLKAWMIICAEAYRMKSPRGIITPPSMRFSGFMFSARFFSYLIMG